VCVFVDAVRYNTAVLGHTIKVASACRKKNAHQTRRRTRKKIFPSTQTTDDRDGEIKNIKYMYYVTEVFYLGVYFLFFLPHRPEPSGTTDTALCTAAAFSYIYRYYIIIIHCVPSPRGRRCTFLTYKVYTIL